MENSYYVHLYGGSEGTGEGLKSGDVKNEKIPGFEAGIYSGGLLYYKIYHSPALPIEAALALAKQRGGIITNAPVETRQHGAYVWDLFRLGAAKAAILGYAVELFGSVPIFKVAAPAED